jgi:hypothetical protein
MSSIAHTAEPWHGKEWPGSGEAIVYDGAGRSIATVRAGFLPGETETASAEQLHERRRANLNRIVACVNACGPNGAVTQALNRLAAAAQACALSAERRAAQAASSPLDVSSSARAQRARAAEEGIAARWQELANLGATALAELKGEG